MEGGLSVRYNNGFPEKSKIFLGRSRIFLALTLATAFSLLAVALPASPALAADPSISLYPEGADIGDSVDIDGDGFDKSTDITTVFVDIYFTKENGDIDDIDDLKNYEVWTKSVDTDGEFTKSFIVPSILRDGDDDEDVTGGVYYVYITYKDKKNIEAVAEFTVIAGTIELDPDKGTVGTKVEITGAYFSGNDSITVTFGDVDLTDEIEDDTETDSDREFVCTILVPASTAGEYTIAVEDEHDHIATATFTVEPAMTISPASGASGREVTVTGTGFGGDQDVTITFDGTQVAITDASSVGSFTANFGVPVAEAATYAVVAEDDDGNTATASFTVAAGVSLSTVTTEDSPGYVGMEMTMSGTGFLPDAWVTITYATAPITVATTTSNADGEFSATFTIPPSQAGTHTITASDSTNPPLTTTFYMESTPPSISSPLLPEMGVKAGQPVHFDWGDVTDLSGVTYTLNIAKDEDFTSLVLERGGLTESEYTITAEEKLASTKKDAPYYWRVKAIDGASNESEWSGAGTFYVGGFSFPSWIIHLLWGLGAMGAGLGGYHMGKRRAYNFENYR